MLHTLSISPWHTDMNALMRVLKEGDDLLLRADGVVAAIEGSRFLDILRSAPISLHVLQEDVEARGLCGQISNSVVRVSYTDFVRLAVKHASQMAW
ncbi:MULTISPECIES: sulfurtransferase complex subunit TusB [Pseudocitrobacter]|uniref:Protein TusB n=1 Tax=Pseudocitrobacter faecalis TaxID=1398493 RepID=A0ABX9FUI5_9ENTR|nr:MULTISPECIES: sulfurtransferase complex subunit TusB [Pseudocitrobacter]RAU45985.1 sulfurtransferase complex subunit TusB [Pseudocitrobacter sp. RIT 415]RBP10305.1 tRNA 2-thiouridine synthesizing protein B [Pseudocitrobacter faecalis]UYW73468.1 sulfurtransferase complex subunit TusB [Pseudocitrobacter faecalis]GHD95246.1 protein TusB [Pseudocitrobacter faecalis]